MIRCLMSSPEHDDPLNNLAANQYKDEATDYNTIVKRFTDMYANEDFRQLRDEMVARIRNMCPDIPDDLPHAYDRVFSESKKFLFDEQRTSARLSLLFGQKKSVISEPPVAKRPKTTGDVIDLTED